MSLGLTGAHRTGKTTLAREVSMETDLPLIETRVSEVYERAGMRPDTVMSFEQRLDIQHQILDYCIPIWAAEKEFISDRTPICMMAYTLADIGIDCPDRFKEVQDYMNRCFEVCNRFFSTLVIIQPGIPIVAEPGKLTASLHLSYIEHLNTLIFGLVYDERCETPALYIRRDATSLKERVNAVLYARLRAQTLAELNHGYESGKSLVN